MRKHNSFTWRLVSYTCAFALIFATIQTTFAQYVCQLQPGAVVQTGSLTAGDPTQAGRVVRGGIPSTCIGKSNTLQNSTAVNQDFYTINAPVTGCATVDFDALQCGGATTQAVAYSTFNPAAPATNVIGDFGFSTTGVARFSFPVTQGQNYTIVIHDILETPTNLFCANYTFTITYRTGCRQPGYDRSNDGRADPTYYRPSTGTWSVLNSAGGTNNLLFGLSADIPTAGDYTGDGQTDVSTYRSSANRWFYSTSQTSPETNVASVPWGLAGDIPTPGDFDGDGKSDIAVWRPSDGVWYVLRSSDLTPQFTKWGQNGDIPVVGDFDGDLRTDFTIVRPNEVAPNYRWYLLTTNFSSGFPLVTNWGTAGDRIAPGDYDGNGKTDIAVFRPSDGVWYSIPSNTQNAINTVQTYFRWGTAGDIPQPADYDGDRRTDYAVFRPSTGVWWIINSNNGAYDTLAAPNWGVSTDQPTSAPYLVTNP